MREARYLWVVSAVLILVASQDGTAAPSRPKRDAQQQKLLKAMNYLVSFNYMQTGALVSGVQRTAIVMENSIKKFQAFANLRITGKLDKQTLNKMAQPRCGIPDIIWSGDTRRRKRYAFQGTRWNKKTITWRIEDYTPDIRRTDLQRRAIRMAFDMWTRASKLRFVETRDPKADIRISFKRYFHNDGNPFDGQGGVLAHAFYPYDSSTDIAGDMHFDEDETWSTDGRRNTIDLFQVAAHELGHSLGLAHSQIPNALMAPFYAGYKDPARYRLPDDDVRAIQALYGVPDVVRPVTAKPFVVVPPAGAPDPCNTPWDAAFLGRDKRTYAFMGEYVASINNQRIDEGYPKPIRDVFPGLSPRNKVIDAAVTTPRGYTYLFSGSEYWVYYGYSSPKQPFKRIGRDPSSEAPRNIRSRDFPRNMDALMLWSGNGQIYAFKSKYYWRLHPSTFKVAHGYPRQTKPVWKGIPSTMDAAVTWSNGRTYFFRQSQFWRFNNHKLRYSKGFPKKIETGWIGCGIRKAVGRAIEKEDGN